ncbi:hypothetical protein F2Q69_00034045 [Brassica cretica]|uniref:CASP-like protein n=1 Tax=Brassica cretica TaxID=69181 RepID=A0A8S9SW76_BRACR|nr:hypothetical protein F2Q69_00034045 [Brassica cretica]
MVRLRESEVILRLCIVALLILSSVLIGLDSQTKDIAYIHKRVTFRYLFALEIELYINVVAAAYNIVQLGFGWFCFQIGSAIILNYIAAVLMIILSFISAFSLFRLYSPKRYFQFKSAS